MTATFDACLAGQRRWLELASGEQLPLPVGRWHDEPSHADLALLERCHGPSIDLGCGPGRLVGALQRKGIPALGVDHSELAIQLAFRRGATVLRRDILGPLPGEGRWRHALLADGNIGIGGDPELLLHRVARLVAPQGTVLIELAEPGRGLHRAPARFAGTDWFPWALLAPEAVGGLARQAGLRRRWTASRQGRWFAELVRE